MHCNRCGELVTHAEARFCRRCGNPLQEVVVGKGQGNNPGSEVRHQMHSEAEVEATKREIAATAAVGPKVGVRKTVGTLSVSHVAGIAIAVLAGAAFAVIAMSHHWPSFLQPTPKGGPPQGFAANTTENQPSSPGNQSPDQSSSVKSIIAKTLPSLAYVDVLSDTGESIGSGFLLDKQGDIVTNAHVVAGAQSITVKLQDGPARSAQVIGIDDSRDIAEVRVPDFANGSPLSLSHATAQLGDAVIAMGNPLGLNDTVTSGMISGLHRNFTIGSVQYQDMYQISAPIAPGNSGGPLISATTGRVLGIDTAGVTQGSGNIAFAIPINKVEKQLLKWAKQPMDATSIQTQLSEASQMESASNGGGSGSSSDGNGSGVGNGTTNGPSTGDNGSGSSSSGSASSGAQSPAGDLETQCLDLISTYYNDVNQQDFLDAYALLGQQLQSQLSFKQFVTGYSNTIQSTVGNASYTPLDSNSGSVDFTLQAQEVAPDGSAQNSVYQIVDTFGYEDGQLRIEHSTMTLVSRN